jgi:molybdate transport system substrate-binding protein
MSHRMSHRVSLLLVSLLVSLLGACSREDEPSERPEATEPRELVVFAAASLREAFGDLEPALRAAHPEVGVTFNFAGTQELRTQLEHGARADVFASADQRHMSELVTAQRVLDPIVFARNEPVVVVARERAGAIRTFADLPAAERIVLGVPDVPIGRYTNELLDRASASPLGSDFRARVEARVVSRELNVRQVLAKVSLGEADAGVVYRTDATDRVGVVDIPRDVNVIAEYPIAVVSDARDPALARVFIDVVLSDAGRAALEQRGFMTP